MSALALYIDGMVLLFGALIGSFLNVVIIRWPREMSIVKPRSSCPGCQTMIAWYDNIPILSWIILRGKCRTCGTSISVRYPMVEALTAFLSWLTFVRFVPTLADLSLASILTYLFYFAFVSGLIAITFIDLEHYLIPNEISLPAIPIGILGAWGLDLLGGESVGIRSAALGALAGGGSLWLLREVYYRIRGHEGMGLGDVKMMAMLGAFLGLHPALIFIVFVSSFLGSVVGITAMVLHGKDMKHPIPFGPFLALAGLIYLYWGETLAPLFIPLAREFQ